MIDRSPGRHLVRWPLIEDRDWHTFQGIDFMKGLRHAFRYVHGTRLVVLNSRAGLTAGILAANFPAARVSASDAVCWSSSTFQMAEINGLNNVDFVQDYGLSDVTSEESYDCALVLDAGINGVSKNDLVAAAVKAVRPGGRVILVAAETGGNGGQVQERIHRAGLAIVHQSRVNGFSVYIGQKAGPYLP